MPNGENVLNLERSTGEDTQDQAGQERFKCELCPQDFKRRVGLRRHFKRIHTKREETFRFKCVLCEKNLSDYANLENHINAHLGLKPYKCEVCSRRFTDGSALNSHKKVAHATGERMKNWKCSKCEKSYFRKGDLFRHFKEVHEGIRYSCSTCSLSFTQRGYLKIHQLIHEGVRPFHCKKCPKKCRTKGDLNFHFKRKHVGEAGKSHKCNDCTKTFFTRLDLQRHALAHANNTVKVKLPKITTCSLCSKTFGQRTHLEAHTRSHTLERPYKCLQCPKTFRTGSGLQRHKDAKHDMGKNGLNCVFCNLRCATEFNLHVHYLRHVDERPYDCRHCEKSFCRNGDLKAHLKKHSRAKKVSHR